MQKQIKGCLECLYLMIIFGICLIPLLAMSVKASDNEKENRTLAAIPQRYGQEGINWNYIQELGKYFEDHFAFRQELVSMDAMIKAELFEVSSVSDVIVGKNGWLYYTATLDDFQHRNLVSDRMLFNIAHNLLLMQQYTESMGKQFLFIVAPNKNSLYGENMPARLSCQVAEKSDIERLRPWLEQTGINYVDLFQLFSSQNEILYYKRDSHWNQKGAVLVYDLLLDACNKRHKIYDDDDILITNDYYGDLNMMLFPTGAKPEQYLNYKGGNTWEYRQGETVEDTIIITECKEGSQNLLMYRDSFGNSLIPLVAGEFSKAVFSKYVPYTMTDLVTYEPDIVILEKVERHLHTLGKIPPVMSAPEVRLDEDSVIVDNNANYSIVKEGSYWKITGTVDSEGMSVDSRIFVEIEEREHNSVYETFCIEINEKEGRNDFGFAIYISEVVLKSDNFKVRILKETEQ